MNQRSVLTVRGLCEKHPSLKEGGIRDLIFKAKSRKNSNGELLLGNGLEEARAIIRLGRKILLDEERFFEWMDSKQCEAGEFSNHRISSSQHKLRCSTAKERCAAVEELSERSAKTSSHLSRSDCAKRTGRRPPE